MPVIQIFTRKDSSHDNDDLYAVAAVMAASLAKANEPVPAIHNKVDARGEKTRPRNPNQLITSQHVFPRKNIARFCNQKGVASVYDLKRGKIFPANPNNPVFCADRAWDHRSERQMKYIEDEFQALVAPILKENIGTIPPNQKAVIDRMYALWVTRARFRYLSNQEMVLNGINGTKLNKEEEENLERKGFLFVRSGGAIPTRQINGLQIMLRVGDLERNFAADILRWGVVKTISGEFIVPDLPLHGILPITPNIALIHSTRDGHISDKNRNCSPPI